MQGVIKMERAKIIANLHADACRKAGYPVRVDNMRREGVLFLYDILPLRANGLPDIGGGTVDASLRWGAIAEASVGLGVTWSGMSQPQTFTVEPSRKYEAPAIEAKTPKKGSAKS